VSAGYQTVGWNRQKRLYDLTLAAGVGGCFAVFTVVTLALQPEATFESIVIRGSAVIAFALLHVILAIGPLCRLDPRFLPLLYNRRHLGVTMALLALLHGGFALFQFHALGVLSPWVSVLVNDGSFSSPAMSPFQVFGVAALGILLVMAATSHDFWLANLTAPVWKALHQLVYLAYVLLVAHVALGAGQTTRGAAVLTVTAVGATSLILLHWIAARREGRIDACEAAASAGSDPDWVDACALAEVPDNRARVVRIVGDRVAIFRYDGRLSAVSSICQHQNGPLGEGRIIDGCITCPWHGYQYKPDTGASPAPFTERVPTFRVRIVGDRVQVDRRPQPPGTRVEPARLP
jgi:nitrite reductase/ring-hydroxylating ferredoxin subunit/DMSO/TMAO reductase YedYZ heme-binding membrane subunit